MVGIRKFLAAGVLAGIAILAILAVLLPGCSQGWPIKWQPTEQQQQAADLTVQDLQALAPHTDEPGEPIRLEALTAAKATQKYMGLPDERLETIAPDNLEIIDQAIADSERPPPTPGETAGAVLDKTKEVVNIGFGLAHMLMAAAGSVATIWGLAKGKTWISNIQTRAVDAETRVGLTLKAATEMVAGIDALDPTTKAAVLAKQDQSPATEAIIRKIRHPEPVATPIPVRPA